MLKRFGLLLGPGLLALRRSTGCADEIVVVDANSPTRKLLPVIAAPGRLRRDNLPLKKGDIRPDGAAR